MPTVSDSEILKLWKDPSFEGSYRGIETFKILLKTNFDYDISTNRLQSILKNEPLYVMHQKPIRKFPRRSFDVRTIGEVIEGDLASMFSYKGFKYFLLLVDVYSSRLFAKPLKSKTSKAVQRAFNIFYDEFPSEIHVLETDKGSEFIGLSNYFKNKHTVWKVKYGQHKANR